MININCCVLLVAIESYYASLKANIEDEAINKIVFNYASPSYGACLIGPDILYSLAQDSKKMQKLIVPKEKPKKVCCVLFVLKTLKKRNETVFCFAL